MVRSMARLSALLWLMAASSAFAVDGQIGIPFTPAPPPYIITMPWSYVLTTNVTAGVTGAPLITIAIPGAAAPGQDVVIDLHGFALNNMANPGFPVISITGPAPREVVIKNGTLIGGSDGIAAPGGARKVVIEDVQIGNSVMNGIHLSNVENFFIRRCVISYTGAGMPPAPGGIGILADTPGVGVMYQGTIEENLIKATYRNGIVIATTFGANELLRGTVTLQKNQLDEVNTSGTSPAPAVPVPAGAISLVNPEPCLVADNTIRGVGGIGIFGLDAQGCKLVDNVLSDTSGDGIQLDPTCQDNFLIHNVVRGSFVDGVHIFGARNVIEGNVMHNAPGTPGFMGFGLHFAGGSSGNRFGRNSAVGNAGAPCAFPTSTDFCDDTGPSGTNYSFGDNMMPGPGKI